jgi:hypothetical protein
MILFCTSCELTPRQNCLWASSFVPLCGTQDSSAKICGGLAWLSNCQKNDMKTLRFRSELFALAINRKGK